MLAKCRRRIWCCGMALALCGVALGVSGLGSWTTACAVEAAPPSGEANEQPLARVEALVDLQPVPSGNTPELQPYGNICINAQDDYKKTKWKAIVKPKYTATANVKSLNTNVELEEIDGHDLNKLHDGDTFWAKAKEPVGWVGLYPLEIVHNEFTTVKQTRYGTVFKFKFLFVSTDSKQTTGHGSFAGGDVHAYRTYRESPGASTAEFIRSGRVFVITDPLSSCTGDVESAFQALHTGGGEVFIKRWAQDTSGTVSADVISSIRIEDSTDDGLALHLDQTNLASTGEVDEKKATHALDQKKQDDLRTYHLPAGVEDKVLVEFMMKASAANSLSIYSADAILKDWTMTIELKDDSGFELVE